MAHQRPDVEQQPRRPRAGRNSAGPPGHGTRQKAHHDGSEETRDHNPGKEAGGRSREETGNGAGSQTADDDEETGGDTGEETADNNAGQKDLITQ